jgi:hypothetical protein
LEDSGFDNFESDGTLNTGAGWNGAIDLEGWDVKMDPVKGPIVSARDACCAISGR